MNQKIKVRSTAGFRPGGRAGAPGWRSLTEGPAARPCRSQRPITEEFASYGEAAEFWDKHDTTHYPGKFRTVKVVSEFRNRHYEIPIDGDVALRLQQRARKAGVPPGRLASELLRKQLRAAG